MRKILAAQRMIARDQNKVFVERANARKLSPSDAEATYELGFGKGNAYIEFDVEPDELRQQYNTRLKSYELFLVGSMALADRNVTASLNW